MRKSFWFGSLLLGAVAAVTYLGTDYACANPGSRFAQVAALAFQIGVRLSPLSALPAVRAETTPIAANRVHVSAEACSPGCCADSSCPAAGACGMQTKCESLSTAAALADAATPPTITLSNVESPPLSVGKAETFGSIVVVPDADGPASTETTSGEAGAELASIPTGPTDEPRPPAVMPLIEDEPATCCGQCWLSACWQRFQREVVATVKESCVGQWLFGTGVNGNAAEAGGVVANERNFDIQPGPAAPRSTEKPAPKPKKLDAVEESEETKDRIQSLLPARSGLDTLDYRPSDGRKGEFDPQPW